MPALLTSLLQELTASPPAVLVRTSVWLYPLLETIHVVGLGLLFGGIAALDLRLFGINADLPVRRLAVHLLPWVWTGFVLNAASGALLFASDAPAFAANRAFQVKMALLVLAGANALWFQWRVYASVDDWNRDGETPVSAKAAALISLILWLAVIAAGRMIAYWE